MEAELPQGLIDNLVSGEEIFKILKTRSIIRKPEWTVLTDRRILYFNEKILGRYDLKDIPYSRLQEMNAERGRISFGSIGFHSETKQNDFTLDKVPKDDIQPFVETLELAINNIAIEPITIKRSKGLMGKMSWDFNKTPEMLFRSRSPDAQTLSRKDFERADSSEDPLQALKMRFVKGEITEEEYLKMKGILE